MDLSPFALRFVLSPLHHVKIAKKPDDSTRAGKPKCDSAMSPRLEQCHVPRQAVSSNVSAAHIFRKNIAYNCTCTHNAVQNVVMLDNITLLKSPMDHNFVNVTTGTR